jgi:hypothetical protein
MLQGEAMKGVAQQKLSDTGGTNGRGGNSGKKGNKRSGTGMNAIVRVEPTDDLTVCITPTAGALSAKQSLSLSLSLSRLSLS